MREQGRDDIKRVEGILIESFRRKYGHFSPWNNIGGSVAGQKSMSYNGYSKDISRELLWTTQAVQNQPYNAQIRLFRF